jgi:hypothetical protein
VPQLHAQEPGVELDAVQVQVHAEGVAVEEAGVVVVSRRCVQFV